MNHVADTHALVWYFLDSPRLSKKALACFEDSFQEGYTIIPAVVLAEVQYISRKGRVSLEFSETVSRIEAAENFEVAFLELEVLKISDSIMVDLEMHDRLIVATALYHDAGLITRDEAIRKSGLVKTIW